MEWRYYLKVRTWCYDRNVGRCERKEEGEDKGRFGWELLVASHSPRVNLRAVLISRWVHGVNEVIVGDRTAPALTCHVACASR
jgi:hypothetical protein